MTTTRSTFGAQPSPAEIAARVAGYGAWLEIDLDAIGRNLERLRRRVGAGTDLMPCVKNNAYGHGLLPVVAYLAEQGVGRILVVRLREAEQIADVGIPVRVLNMGPLFTDAQYESVVRRGIVQAIYTREVAEQLSDAAGRVGVEAAVFVKVDTGLRRVGVWHEEAAELVERVAKLPGLKVEGIFSTLSQSAEQDPVQIERLLAVDAALRARGIDPGLRSLASSDAMLHRPAAHLDLVRPGALIYGVYPEKKDLAAGLELEQALALKARIEHVKWVERGRLRHLLGALRRPRAHADRHPPARLLRRPPPRAGQPGARAGRGPVPVEPRIRLAQPPRHRPDRRRGRARRRRRGDRPARREHAGSGRRDGRLDGLQPPQPPLADDAAGSTTATGSRWP